MFERNISPKNSVALPGIDPGTVRLVVQLLNHYAHRSRYRPGPSINSGFYVSVRYSNLLSNKEPEQESPPSDVFLVRLYLHDSCHSYNPLLTDVTLYWHGRAWFLHSLEMHLGL